MTCNHVIGLIDAGPFADYPSAHLEAAWEHARQCPTCGPALRVAGSLTVDLRTLPQLAPSHDLGAGVLARVAAMEARASAEAVSDIEPTRSPVTVLHGSDWGTAIGVLASTAAVALVVSGTVSIPDPSADRSGAMGWLTQMPAATDKTLLLAACLLLYAIGLFTPTAGERERESI